MDVEKQSILSRLKREIASLEGFKAYPTESPEHSALGPLRTAFPNGIFPTGAVHEFIATGCEDAAASIGFGSNLLTTASLNTGTILWINPAQTVFPSALLPYGIEPHRVVFVTAKNPKHVFWATEEALGCKGVSAVISELQSLDMTASRRLQLAVEGSGVTGLLLRNSLRHLQTTASVTRWHIRHLSSMAANGRPGVGRPRWSVELIKVRNGRPGAWYMEWVDGRFREVTTLKAICFEPQRKAV